MLYIKTKILKFKFFSFMMSFIFDIISICDIEPLKIFLPHSYPKILLHDSKK